MKTHSFFAKENLTSLQKNSLAEALSTLRFQKDQTIVTEGEPGSSYYIIKSVIIIDISRYSMILFCLGVGQCDERGQRS